MIHYKFQGGLENPLSDRYTGPLEERYKITTNPGDLRKALKSQEYTLIYLRILQSRFQSLVELKIPDFWLQFIGTLEMDSILAQDTIFDAIVDLQALFFYEAMYALNNIRFYLQFATTIAGIFCWL